MPTTYTPAQLAVIGCLAADHRGCPVGRGTREEIGEPLLTAVRERIRLAGESLRANELPKHETWCGPCDRCDLVALCRDRPNGKGRTN